MPTIIPVYDEFGSYASTKAAGFNNGRNPVRRLTENAKDDKNYTLSVFGNVYAELTPIEGLTLRTSLGGSLFNYYYTDYNYRYLGDSETEASNSFGEGSGTGTQWVFSNTATYRQNFGKHGIKLLAGLEALNTGYGRQMSGTGINPFSTDLDYVNLSTVSNPQVNSNLYNGVNFFSTFGKVDYNFDEKYYITGLVRRDGASRFGANARYGTFPAASAAWRVTSESFMQGLTWINELKVRGGWGEMGNSNNVDPAKYGINKISLAFFDMDLGTPTLIGLEFIKTSLVVGSIISFDQYFAYKGSKEKGESYAFKEFREKNTHLVFRKYKNWGIRGMCFILIEIKK
jgi:hypothetical protein